MRFMKRPRSKNKHKLITGGSKDGSNQYFISQEKKSLSVYDLDPDSSSTLRLPPLKGIEWPRQCGCRNILQKGVRSSPPYPASGEPDYFLVPRSIDAGQKQIKRH